MPFRVDLAAKEANSELPLSSPSGTTARLGWLPCASIALLLVVLYYRVAIKLVYDWSTIPDYSHGFLVPFFAAFLIWDKRKVIQSTPIRQSWLGVPLVVFSLAVL